MAFLVTLFIILVSLSLIGAECPNACSGHGKCGQYDACTCYRNWMENDCSGRMCQFGMAHVDTPLGDLDGSHSISDSGTTVVKGDMFYPKGVQEAYPITVDTNGAVLTETGHYYRECSGKGWCDRLEGLCLCQDGYSGSACQYLSCPMSDVGVCSGHGICESVSKIAQRDNGNIYRLWDEHSTLGCVCDSGYYGYDCSYRYCKQGYDPQYIDNPDQSYRYSNWSYIIYQRHENATIYGNYSIFFYDVEGHRWETAPIDYNASCAQVISRLEKLPNNVIPAGSVRCLKWPDFHNIPQEDEPFLHIVAGVNPFYGIKYTIVFPRNPGLLKEIDINIHTEYGSKAATLYTDETTLDVNPTATSLGWFVYPNGFTGEFDDYFHDRCEYVDATISTQIGPGNVMYQYLSGLTNFESRLLKRCLGDADGKSNKYSQRVNIQGQTINFDFGTVTNPHIIKLVDTTDPPLTDICNNENGEGKRGSSSTRLCRYGFATSQDSEDFPHVSPADEQLDTAEIIPNHARLGDKPYFGPDTSKRPPSFYAAVIYDSTTSRFKLFTKPGEDYADGTNFAIFTTKGTAVSASNDAKVFTSPNIVSKNARRKILGDGMYSNILYTTNTTSTYNYYNGDVSCEQTPTGSYGVINCIEKNAWVFVFDPTFTVQAYQTNPKYLNMYRVDRISAVQDLPVRIPLYGEPTLAPTFPPTKIPTAAPTAAPSATPTVSPTVAPTVDPTLAPTPEPTLASQINDTQAPTPEPTIATTNAPTPEPTEAVVAAVEEEPAIETNFYRSKIQLNFGVNAYYPNEYYSEARIYTFYPHEDSTYNYVGECSGRGECDWDPNVGRCACHVGYNLDDCSYQFNPET